MIVCRFQGLGVSILQAWKNAATVCCKASALFGVLLFAGCVARLHDASISKHDGVLGASALNRAEALSFYSRAVQASVSGNTNEAIEAYQQALLLEPGHETLYRELAIAYIDADRLDEGVTFFRQQVTDHDGVVSAHRWLGVLLQMSGNPEEAVEQYAAVMRMDPADVHAYIETARLVYASDDWKSSFRTLEKGLGRSTNTLDLVRALKEFVPADTTANGALEKHLRSLLERIMAAAQDDPEVLREVVRIYFKMGDLDQATELAESIVERVPADAETHKQIAGMLMSEGKVDEAVAGLEACLDLVDNPGEIHRLLGELLAHQSALDERDERSSTYRKRAIVHLKKARMSYPSAGDLLYILGELLAREERFVEAADVTEDLAALLSRDAGVVRRLIRYYIGADQNEKALQALEEVIGDNPLPGELSLRMGDALAQAAHPDAAVGFYRQSIDDGWQGSEPYLRMAALYEDDVHKAVAILEEALPYFPEDAVLLEFTGHLYLKKGAFDEAVRFFDRTLGHLSKPPRPSFHIHYIYARDKLGETDQAAELLSIQLTNDIRFLSLYFDVAASYVTNDNYTGLLELMERARSTMNHNADDSALDYHIALCHHFNKNYASALVTFERVLPPALDQKPALFKAQFYFWYGATLERLKRLEAAEGKFMKAIEVEPQFAEAYNYAAYMWAEKGQKLGQALEWVKTALTFNPESAAFIDTLGWIYYQEGKYEKALEMIQQAETMLPEDPTIVEHMGDIYLKLNELNAALEWWEKAVRLGSENSELPARIDQLKEQLGK